jgi:N-acetylmuramoyl-L-alanine amidase-like
MKINKIRSLVGLTLVLCVASAGWGQAVDAGSATQGVAGVGAGVDAQIDELEARIAELKRAREELGEVKETPDATEVLAGGEEDEPAAPVALTQKQRRICEELGIDPKQLAGLIAKPLYEFNEPEVDVYLRYLSVFEPELPRRVAHLARKNIGQPYEIYLLGEMPFEHYDPQPIYSLGKSDCLVYAEHTYAMALTDSWEGFIRMLQRVRYKDGRIGVVTRNHYTEADWNPNNRWLVRDITAELARNRVVRFGQKVDRAKFLRNRYKLETDIPVKEYEHVFIRFEDIDMAKPRLRDGDFVNIVRGTPAKPGGAGAADGDSQAKGRGAKPGTMRDIFGGSAWVGHTGLIVLGENGEVHLIHSARPAVREEPIDDYIARSTQNLEALDAAGKARLLGFKFLRLQKDPLGNLRKIDGPDAPRVTLPGGGELK